MIHICFFMLILAGIVCLCSTQTDSKVMPEDTKITITNEVTHPVSDMLFGQFLERPSWGKETGPEAAVLPGTHKLDPRVESLLRHMVIPIVRFPGGTDVDYTDWRNMVTDGLGDKMGRPDNRGVHGDVITNAFGYDEYFRLAEKQHWQTILVVNLRAGLLTDQAPTDAAAHAAALLAYCVGTKTTVPDAYRQWPMLRASNGHLAPYKVDYVQIGNESWFWQGEMKKKYGDAWVKIWADTIQEYMTDVRRIQPGIKVIADGHPLDVSAELHRRRAGVDLFAQHKYYPLGIDGLFTPDGTKLTEAAVTTEQVWNTLTHCTPTDADGLANFQDDSIEQAKRLGYRLAITEWNLNAWWSLPRRNELWPGSGACGLGAAVMLQAMVRQGGTLSLATQSMLLGKTWGITGIRVSTDPAQAPTLQPTAEATTLYHQYHGDRALLVRYDSAPICWQPVVKFNINYRAHDWPCTKAAVVDILATRDRKHLYLHAINSDYTQSRRVIVNMNGFTRLPATSTLHRLCFHTPTEFATIKSWTTHEDERVHREKNDFIITLPPRSLTIGVFDL